MQAWIEDPMGPSWQFQDATKGVNLTDPRRGESLKLMVWREGIGVELQVDLDTLGPVQ